MILKSSGAMFGKRAKTVSEFAKSQLGAVVKMSAWHTTYHVVDAPSARACKLPHFVAVKELGHQRK